MVKQKKESTKGVEKKKSAKAGSKKQTRDESAAAILPKKKKGSVKRPHVKKVSSPTNHESGAAAATVPQKKKKGSASGKKAPPGPNKSGSKKQKSGKPQPKPEATTVEDDGGDSEPGGFGDDVSQAFSSDGEEGAVEVAPAAPSPVTAKEAATEAEAQQPVPEEEVDGFGDDISQAFGSDSEEEAAAAAPAVAGKEATTEEETVSGDHGVENDDVDGFGEDISQISGGNHNDGVAAAAAAAAGGAKEAATEVESSGNGDNEGQPDNVSQIDSSDHEEEAAAASSPAVAKDAVADMQQQSEEEEIGNDGENDEPEASAGPSLEKVADIFASIDLNNDGKVSKEELSAALETDSQLVTLLQIAGISSAHYVLEQMDADGDGTIDMEEFKAAVHASSRTASSGYLDIGQETPRVKKEKEEVKSKGGGDDEGEDHDQDQDDDGEKKKKGKGKGEKKKKKSGSVKKSNPPGGVYLKAPFGIVFGGDAQTGVVVDGLKPGRVAEQSGEVKVGMEIISIDGILTNGLAKEEVSQLVKDRKGQSVLVVFRPGNAGGKKKVKKTSSGKETTDGVVNEQPKKSTKGSMKKAASKVQSIISKPTLNGSFCGALTVGGNIQTFSESNVVNKQPVREQPEHKSKKKKTGKPSFKFDALFDYVKNVVFKDYFKENKKVKAKDGMPIAELEKGILTKGGAAEKHIKTDSTIDFGVPSEKCTHETDGQQLCEIQQSPTRGMYCKGHSCACGKPKEREDDDGDEIKQCQACEKNKNRSLLIQVLHRLKNPTASTVNFTGNVTFETFCASVKASVEKGPKGKKKKEGVTITDLVEYTPIEKQKQAIEKLTKEKTKLVLDESRKAAKVKAVRHFIEGGDSSKKMTGQAVGWVINALDVAPHNKLVKDLMDELLAKPHFSRELESVDSAEVDQNGQKKTQFQRLKDGARQLSDRIGEARLKPLYTSHDLGKHFSAESFPKMIQWHPVRTKVYDKVKGKDLSEDEVESAMKVSQTWAIPELYTLMHNELDIDWEKDPFPQRVSLVAHLMYSHLLADLFNEKMEKLASQIPDVTFGDGDPKEVKKDPKTARAPTKGYSRSFNKIFSENDYLDLPSDGGRAAWIVDSLRCLFAGKSVKAVQDILEKLVKEMGGLLGAKNPFDLTEGKRGGRSHLLLMNVAVLFDSMKTVGEIVNGEAAEAIFKKFRKSSNHREPNSRWTQLCTDAQKILQDPRLAQVRARIAAEVQITFESFKEARHDMHDAYNITRADKDVQLFNQFAGAALTPDQRKDATDLSTACLRGQIEVVKNFFKGKDPKDIVAMIDQKGTEENPKGLKKGKTAMYYAVKNNHPDVLKELLAQGAELTEEDQDLALDDGFVEITNQIKLNAEQATKRLHQAVSKNQADQVKGFLGQGANPNALNKSGQTALSLAVQLNVGNVEMVSILLEEEGKTKAKRASFKADKASKQVAQGDDADASTAGPKSVEIITVDVDAPNKNGDTPFFLALSAKNAASVITILVKHGADVKQKLKRDGKPVKFFPLITATKKGDYKLVKFLIGHGFADQVNAETKTGSPLIIATNNGSLEVMEVLLKHSANANVSSEQGSPLYIAVCKGDAFEKHVKLLAENGADVNTKSKQGPPITIATKTGSIQIMKVLVKHGADVNIQLSSQSLLAYALKESNAAELVPVLAKGSGADAALNEKDKSGKTQLYKAAERDQLTKLSILLKCGAKPNLKGPEGRTALDIAKEKGHSECVDHLYASGAHEGECTRCMRCCTNPRFKHGPFSCCDSGCAVCLIDGCICMPHSFAKVHSGYGGCYGYLGGCICLCTPFIGPYFLRKKVEAASGIKEDNGVTYFFTVCCNWCSLMQLYQEGLTQGKIESCAGDVECGLPDKSKSSKDGEFDYIDCLINSWFGEDYWCEKDSNMCCRSTCREKSGFEPVCCCGSTCGFGATTVCGVVIASIVTSYLSVACCYSCLALICAREGLCDDSGDELYISCLKIF